MWSQDGSTSASSQHGEGMTSKELPGDSIRRLRSEMQTASKRRLPVSPDPHSVSVDWEKLRETEGEAKIPVVPYVLCKRLVEDDQGALFLTGTVTQVTTPLDGARDHHQAAREARDCDLYCVQ